MCKARMMSKRKSTTNSRNAWGKDQWHNGLTSALDGDKRRRERGGETGFQIPSPTPTFSFMPHDGALCYFVPGAFRTHMILCMSHMSHTHAANSSHMYPCLYPTALSLSGRRDLTILLWLLSHVDFNCLLSKQPIDFRGRG